MVLIAKKLHEGENDPNERLGLTLVLNATFTVEEALEIAETVKGCGFKGATFAPKRNGTVAIYHTDNLGISADQFENAALDLIQELMQDYPSLSFDVRKYIIQMPRL
jgi:hypothetical protein